MPEKKGNDVLFDPSRLASLNERFGEYGRPGLWLRLKPSIEAAADPMRAMSNLERWLDAGGSSETRASMIDDSPPFARRLLALFGSSQVIANELIRDPDAAMMLLDHEEVSKPILATDIRAEAIRLFASAISFTHKLDQLRFIQKRALAKIVWNDLSGDQPAELVWRSLSELADGLLQGALVACADDEGFDIDNLSVVAMGKHGSRELNYSSDIDLIFVLSDDCEELDKASKFCEKYVRALSGKMGRGDLYRIDLRLRPFGKAGPVAHSLTAMRRYFENYAEPWEVQAMVRARACAGGGSLGEEFISFVRKHVFRGARTELFFDSLLETKKRAEEEHRGTDDNLNIKFDKGGIRDIEFVVQTLQLVAGKDRKDLQDAGTLQALYSLGASNMISHRESSLLSGAYRLLRQVEHRIQLTHSFHSHTIPQGQRDREVLARSLKFRQWSDLEAEVRRQMAAVRSILSERFHILESGGSGNRIGKASLGYEANSREAAALERLLNGVGNLTFDVDSVERVRLLVERAPRVVSEIAFHKELWDVAFSEEAEFTTEDDANLIELWRLEIQKESQNVESLVRAIARRAFVVAAIKQAYHSDVERSGQFQADVTDLLLASLLDASGGGNVDIIALGSYGSRELLLGSDWDVMLLTVANDSAHSSEKAGEEWMRAVRRVSVGSHFPVDVRLRPEGRSGLIVRTPAALIEYGKAGMEAWERISYTKARSVRNHSSSEQCIHEAVYGVPWTGLDEEQARHMRKRVHDERVNPAESSRDIKLGPGSLFDIEWLVALLKLRTDCAARHQVRTSSALKCLAEARAITVYERDALLEAHCFLSLARNAMYLLEMDSDTVLPENPGKLEKLAAWLRLKNANDLLCRAESHKAEVVAVVKSILGESLS